MGALFFFIVCLVISLIAAGVILITSNLYTEQTIITNEQAVRDAGNSLMLIEINAKDGGDLSIDYFYTKIKLGPDSASLGFNNILISLSLANSSSDFLYSPNVNCLDNDTMNPGRTFGVFYDYASNEHIDGRLNSGEIATLCFQSNQSLYPGDAVYLKIIPLIGTQIMLDFNMPDVIYNEIINLYP